MNTPSSPEDTTAHDLRRASLKWLEWFFFLLFITLATWYLFRWWAVLPGVIAGLILVRSINANRVANLLDGRR
jgi:hypothetical protein